MAESLFSYGPDLPYDNSGAAYGVNYINQNVTNQVQQDIASENNNTIPHILITPILGDATSSSNPQSGFGGTNPLSSLVSGIENYVSSGALRVGVVILGFILVASGLTMFKNSEFKISVTK